MEDIINYQYHRCTETCKKTRVRKVRCRFGAPFAPMDQTRILKPLPDEVKAEMTPEKTKELADLLAKIDKTLEEDASSFVDFNEFLSKLGISLDQYLFVLRFSLRSYKVFIKRAPKATRINQYNKKILMMMRSNMDIQFVLDPYSCIRYITDYINKSQRGLSKLMKQTVDKADMDNVPLIQKLRRIGNTLYNGSEISAQEAAWCRLQLPMVRCSNGFETINTRPIDVSF